MLHWSITATSASLTPLVLPQTLIYWGRWVGAPQRKNSISFVERLSKANVAVRLWSVAGAAASKVRTPLLLVAVM